MYAVKHRPQTRVRAASTKVMPEFGPHVAEASIHWSSLFPVEQLLQLQGFSSYLIDIYPDPNEIKSWAHTSRSITATM